MGLPRNETTLYMIITSLSPYNQQVWYQNGAHLKNCSVWECTNTYKCPGGYCIGHSLVCDGIWDCSSGEDEIPNCSTRNCTGLFRCKGSNICVHFSDLCDAVTDCPYEDDEQSCNKFVCPAGCACLMHAMWCVNVTLGNWQHYSSNNAVISSFAATGSKIRSIDRLIRVFPLELTQFLYVQKNEIMYLCTHYMVTNVLILNVSFNLLRSVDKICIQGQKQLTILGLARNLLKSIESGSFLNSHKLIHLDLSFNRLVSIQSTTLEGLQILN